ncbi:MAG: endonuclease/exonuclease/phosphatase family protein [Myxococcota bacterium]
MTRTVIVAVLAGTMGGCTDGSAIETSGTSSPPPGDSGTAYDTDRTSGTGGGDTGATDPTGTTDPSVVPSGDLTVLSLNLHCFLLDGTSFASNEDRFAAIASLAASEQVDALAVQEACVNDAHGVAMDRLAAALESATGVAWGTAWAETHIAWAGTADEATEGVGILSRGTPADPSELTYVRQGTQLRKALSATVTGPSGAQVRLYTVHLDHDDAAARQLQARETAVHALVHSDPAWTTLIAGDYNAVSSDPALTDVAAAGFTRLSAPSDGGSEIDHVFAPSPAGFTVREARLVFEGGAEPVVSDHPGVLLKLTLGAAAPADVTRLIARHDAGFGHAMWVRGDTSPLSWTLGWPAANTASDRWEAVFLGWPSGTVAYKWLVDDVTWQTGSDELVGAGATSDTTPGF